MTRTYETVTATQTVTYQHQKSIVCDWCGVESEFDLETTDEERSSSINRYDNWSWIEREYSFQFGARQIRTHCPPEGMYYGYQHSEGWEVKDLCDNCIVKLRKLLEDSGIKISDIEED